MIRVFSYWNLNRIWYSIWPLFMLHLVPYWSSTRVCIVYGLCLWFTWSWKDAEAFYDFVGSHVCSSTAELLAAPSGMSQTTQSRPTYPEALMQCLFDYDMFSFKELLDATQKELHSSLWVGSSGQYFVPFTFRLRVLACCLSILHC